MGRFERKKKGEGTATVGSLLKAVERAVGRRRKETRDYQKSH